MRDPRELKNAQDLETSLIAVGIRLPGFDRSLLNYTTIADYSLADQDLADLRQLYHRLVDLVAWIPPQYSLNPMLGDPL